MAKETLFGHMASRLIKQQENIATDSLNYIIERSRIARQAFLRHMEITAGIELPKDLTIRTQFGADDKSIRDMVAFNTEGEPVLIVEAKFWAGMTGNQPVAYLRQLPTKTASALVFIAPEARFQSLWAEILQRCTKDGVCFSDSTRERCVTIDNSSCTLSLTSWRQVLQTISLEVKAAKEVITAADVDQLEGFCETIDNEAFTPILPEELSSGIGRRITHFSGLVTDLRDILIDQKIATREGLTGTKRPGRITRYVKIHNFFCSLDFDPDLWAKYRETPLWLGVQGCDWRFSPLAEKLLSSLKNEDPPRLMRVGEWLSIPLTLPTGVERDRVMKSLVSQIKDVAHLLNQTD